MRHMMSFVQKYLLTLIVTNLWWHKTHKKDIVSIVTFDLIVLLNFTNHIIVTRAITGDYVEMFNVNIKIA